jgi:uncharacterized phage-associated protein
MAYDAKSIANYFLEKAEQSGQDLTSMKVLKLVYFAHGWHLAIKDQPLINEQVEAWAYGPVIPSLYRAFRSHGEQPIRRPATHVRVIPARDVDDVRILSFEPAINDKSKDADFIKRFLDRIWTVYGKLTPIQLSNITHARGTPWHHVYTQYNGHIPKGTDIPTSVIKDYFVGLRSQKSATQ